MARHQHLRRLRWIHAREPLVFITTCVAGRRNLLANPVAHEILREEWMEMSKRRGWAVGRYVVMPDHVHFFTRARGVATEPLQVAIGRWKEWSARRIGLASGRRGSLWQSEFFDHVLRSEESRSTQWNYVFENPVRSGLVTYAENWPYSGFIDFE
ncbi:MAG: REP-associated tyrosine transposase [Opitutaceae bacterium]